MGKRIINIIWILLVATVVLSATAIAAPVGLNNSITEVSASRYNDSRAPATLSAQAGNVTELDIQANWTSQVWQGYFGNVTGTVLLATSSGEALYDWSLTAPTGQIYASRNNSITWGTNIGCANAGNITKEEQTLQINTSAEGISETFIVGTHDGFSVGSQPITADQCSRVNLNGVGGANANGNWTVVLLADGSDNLVYASLLENNMDGFDGKAHDFEMLIPDGKQSATPETYYFWAELN